MAVFGPIPLGQNETNGIGFKKPGPEHGVGNTSGTLLVSLFARYIVVLVFLQVSED